MKLVDLAATHNLDQELLQEVCEVDLKIPLAAGPQTVLRDEDVRRILASDGLETADGKPFAPIIAKEFEEKHKRSLAAKKAAATRKQKEQQVIEAKKAEEEARIAEERRKHAEALARREQEEVEALHAAAQAAERAAQEEQRRRETEAAVLRQAEEEARRREEEARNLSAELARLQQEAVDAERRAAAERQAAAPVAAVVEPPPVAAPVASQPVAASPAPVSQPVATAPAAAAPVVPTPTPPPAPAAPVVAAAPLDLKLPLKPGIGSKLATLAKATHEKADHSIKAVKKPGEAAPVSPAAGPEPELSAEDRKRMIQENIRRNLAMQQRVKEAKSRDRKRRGFKTLDNRGRGPLPPTGGVGGRGGPGGARGPAGPGGPPGARPGSGQGSRDRRERRSEKTEQDEMLTRRLARRRLLSSEEEDLSGKTEFSVTLPCTLRDFSEASGLKSNMVIAKLLAVGMVATLNTALDRDTIGLLAQEFKKTVTIKEVADAEEEVEAAHAEDKDEDLAPRPPVVVVMGHVDHGKTSLLDAIRKTQFTAGEAGGITQHIGAYTVETPDGLEVTFIDTPGHQAFTEMRARGATVTDIAVIVVAADDGVMPQTIEAINHAKAAGVAIVIAMNKVDKEGADREKILRQVSEQGLLPEDWGGEIGVMPVSALTGQGIPELIERLALETEVLELKANHFARASGTVLEAHLNEGTGVTATLLVQRGSLAVGDVLLAGTGYGRVRQMTTWKGDIVQLAGPSQAVEVTGLSELPSAGARFHVVEDIRQAADVAETRRQARRDKELAARNTPTTLASLFDDIEESKKKELRLVVKTDAAGSLEVVTKSLRELANDEVRVTIIHSGVGCVTTSDVSLAETSQAVILGFHVIADAKARVAAEERGVSITTYTIIYEMLDQVRLALTGMLDPTQVQEVNGHAEVRAVFQSSKFGAIAGLYVTDGVVQRGALLRLTREGIVIHEGRVNTLRRIKEDVREVRSGFECGMTIDGWNDVKVGDLIEFSISKTVQRIL